MDKHSRTRWTLAATGLLVALGIAAATGCHSGPRPGEVQDEALMSKTPVAARLAIVSAARSIGAALGRLESTGANLPLIPGGPTRQQGQFLAFIREYIRRNQAGVAPRHADLQRFFNLTAPSVNSMLIRLEQRGFIRRIPGQARAIEISCPPDFIPSLDRPFKF